MALDKLGVPFLKLEDGGFNIKKIRLQNVEIDVAELDDIAGQIKAGSCDSFFFEDVECYSAGGARIVVLCSMAVRWINLVISHSSFKEGMVTYLNDWGMNLLGGGGVKY